MNEVDKECKCCRFIIAESLCGNKTKCVNHSEYDEEAQDNEYSED